MKMKLFYLSLDRGSDRHVVQIVAPDAGKAVDFLRDHLDGLGEEVCEPKILRIDQTLTGDARLGLDAMLETAPGEFASFAEGVGWIARGVPVPRLRFFRIEPASGEGIYVIAPSSGVAAAVYSEWLNPKGDEARGFRIHDGVIGLSSEALRGLPELLEFGPVGVVTWDEESGWSLA